MKRTLTLLAPFLLSACATLGPPPPPPLMAVGASATVGLGDRAVLNGIAVAPVRVVEDSRCPINARCVWAGRLVLEVNLIQHATPEGQKINLVLGQPIAVENGRLTLVGAEPGRLAGTEPSPAAKRFTFELGR